LKKKEGEEDQKKCWLDTLEDDVRAAGVYGGGLGQEWPTPNGLGGRRRGKKKKSIMIYFLTFEQ